MVKTSTLRCATLLTIICGLCNSQSASPEQAIEFSVPKVIDRVPIPDTVKVWDRPQHVPAVFKHTSDNELIIDLDVVKQLLALSPHRLHDAAMRGDTRLIGVTLQYLRRLNGVSMPCLLDLANVLKDLIGLALAGEKSLHTGNHVLNLYRSGGKVDNVTCGAHRQSLENEASYLWVLKVFDALGKVSAGILQGNTQWIGSRQACIAIDHRRGLLGVPWKGKYYRAAFFVNWNTLGDAASEEAEQASCDTMIPALSYGICTSQRCSVADVETIINEALKVAGADKTFCQVQVNDDGTLLHLTQDPWAVGMVAFLAVILAAVLFGSLYDYFVYQPNIAQLAESEQQTALYAEQPTLVKLLLAFSVVSNTPKILNTESRPGAIPALHGMRFLSMLWIIFSHTYYYGATSFTMDNLAGVLSAFPTKFLHQIILNGALAVDTFFFLSGFLVCYIWCKHTKKHKARNITQPGFWANFYIHRFLRLTPVYMIVLGVFTTLLYYVSAGPFWQPIEKDRCSVSWWSNLLYINNFVNLDDECMGWTWYLANDQQFYLFAPILLILLWMYPLIGYLLGAVILFGSGAIHLLLIWPHDWPPAPVLTADTSKSNYIIDYWPEVYVKPYVRCAPYVVGVMLAHFMFKRELKFNINKYTAAAGWALCTAAELTVVFGLYHYCKTGEIGSFYYTVFALFSRPVWALGLAWIVLACTAGWGGPINAFLSWKAFIPLSRLTYCAYLIHPIIVITYFRSRQTAFHYGTHVQMVGLFIGFASLAYTISYFASLAFEIPVSHIESITRTDGKTRVKLGCGTGARSHSWTFVIVTKYSKATRPSTTPPNYRVRDCAQQQDHMVLVEQSDLDEHAQQAHPRARVMINQQ